MWKVEGVAPPGDTRMYLARVATAYKAVATLMSMRA